MRALLAVLLLAGAAAAAAAEDVPGLVRALAGDDAYAAGAAARALARLGEPAVPALNETLAHDKAPVRMSAAIALGRMGPAAHDAVPALARALDDKDDDVRAAAAVALGAIGAAARPAVPALNESLHDASEGVRRSARRALQAIDPADRARALRQDALVATLERLVPQLMDELHVPGVGIALVRDRRIVWTRSFGVVDAVSKAPVTRETLFEAASMSKPVFATLAMQLVDRRQLDLDRPLARYVAVPWYPPAPEAARLTARHVLSHTSGLPNWRDGGEEREGGVPFLFEPGARFGYSGEAMYSLQQVVEHVTGADLAARARTALFAPLGMERSTFVWTPAADGALATGHDTDGKPLPRAKYLHPHAAYTLLTTPEEYAKLLVETMNAAHSGTKTLSRRAAQAMLTPQVRVDAREPMERPGAAEGRAVSWGLGWSLNDTAAGRIAHHSGANRTGFRCFSQFAPDRGSALVIMTNGLGGGDLWTRVVATIGDL